MVLMYPRPVATFLSSRRSDGYVGIVTDGGLVAPHCFCLDGYTTVGFLRFVRT